MPSQTPITDSNCDLGNAMIKTKTLRYNHKKARNFKMRFGLLWLFLKYYSKNKWRKSYFISTGTSNDIIERPPVSPVILPVVSLIVLPS